MCVLVVHQGPIQVDKMPEAFDKAPPALRRSNRVGDMLFGLEVRHVTRCVSCACLRQVTIVSRMMLRLFQAVVGFKVER
jgi:hypothetical protein